MIAFRVKSLLPYTINKKFPHKEPPPMPFIPKEEITRLKTETDLLALVRSYGIELKNHGTNWVGQCPFHDDRHPSFIVTPVKNLWHCMGACKTGGSAIDFVMKREGLGFNEAVEVLRKFKPHPDFPMRGKPLTPVALEKALGRKIPTTERLKQEERDLIFQALAYYSASLRQTQSALSYLQTRKVGSEESITKFQIGYSDGSLGKILPSRGSNVGQRAKEVLKEFGFFGEGGQEYFRARIVFPIFTPEKELCGMYGRRILTSKTAGVSNHLYLPGKHLGIWNEEDAFEKKELVLCESILDALTFWENGIRNVTCSYGIEGFTEVIQERIPRKTNPKNIYRIRRRRGRRQGSHLCVSETERQRNFNPSSVVTAWNGCKRSSGEKRRSTGHTFRTFRRERGTHGRRTHPPNERNIFS
ncbi:CHC2 zinc finger domain protein [Leptospira noguchii str. 2007001578]|uniref:CHC2 zinc finger domain protein n=1 Tax=Leptospira noguchii str. 2007001578 TaxID=1049974 RepID=A0ABN0J2C6_9LEPT|nr:CHC2 zinc finger domain protein [Leptospira noguchii str. 2007001578]